MDISPSPRQELTTHAETKQVCNDEDHDVTVDEWKAGAMGYWLLYLCCDLNRAQAGQMFHLTEGWNTVVGYANCRHGVAEEPSAYGGDCGGNNGCCRASGH